MRILNHGLRRYRFPWGGGGVLKGTLASEDAEFRTLQILGKRSIVTVSHKMDA